MSYKIVVLPQAKRDSRDIDEYLAERNPAAADRFSQNLQATLDLQASIPTPGMPWLSDNPATTELRWTRVKGFPKYLIFLRVSGNIMEVVRILHGVRDLDALLGD